jgi:predicted amidophosphoribosyltransferase
MSECETARFDSNDEGPCAIDHDKRFEKEIPESDEESFDDYEVQCESCGFPSDITHMFCSECGHTNGTCDLCESDLQGDVCLECGESYPYAI